MAMDISSPKPWLWLFVPRSEALHCFSESFLVVTEDSTGHLARNRPNESQRHVPDINNFEMRLFSEQKSTAYLNVFVERKIIGSSFLLFIIPDEEQRNRKIKLLFLIPMPIC